MKVSMYPMLVIGFTALMPAISAIAGGNSDLIRKMDRDNDGKVSRAEFKSAPREHKMLKMLDNADEDGDGMMAMVEMEKHHAEMMSRRKDILKEHKADHEQKMREHFEELDTNNDGNVTWNEMEKYHREKRSHRMKKMQEHRADRKEMMHDHFEHMDTNNDGVVTKEEIKASTFSRMDKNGDGYIVADELESSRKRLSGMHERHNGKGYR